jgi:hypothetical protein
MSKASYSHSHILTRNTGHGEIFVSDAAMTALDLVLYADKVGGLERAAEVISELMDALEGARSPAT